MFLRMCTLSFLSMVSIHLRNWCTCFGTCFLYLFSVRVFVSITYNTNIHVLVRKRCKWSRGLFFVGLQVITIPRKDYTPHQDSALNNLMTVDVINLLKTFQLELVFSGPLLLTCDTQWQTYFHYRSVQWTTIFSLISNEKTSMSDPLNQSRILQRTRTTTYMPTQTNIFK